MTQADFDADWEYIDNVREVSFRRFIDNTEGLAEAVTVDAFPGGGADKNQFPTLDGSSVFVKTKVWHLRTSQLNGEQVTQGSVIIDTDGTQYLVSADIKLETWDTRTRCVTTEING